MENQATSQNNISNKPKIKLNFKDSKYATGEEKIYRKSLVEKRFR